MPSVVCYDKSGNVVAVGSEADADTNPNLLEVDGLVMAEWFVLSPKFDRASNMVTQVQVTLATISSRR